MKRHSTKERRHIKGSSVCIAAMYIGVVWYVFAQMFSYWTLGVFLPPEVTYGFFAAFIVETISLARLKLAKEGYNVKPKGSNAFLDRIGISSNIESFEPDAIEISESNKEANNG